MARVVIDCTGALLIIASLGTMACSPRTAPVSVAPRPSPIGRADTLLTKEDSTSARFYVYQAGRFRDPFLRPGTRVRGEGPTGPAEPTPPPLTIQGIITGANPRAMINGRSVGEGDVIEGATVVKISSNSVEIEFNGKRHTIAYR